MEVKITHIDTACVLLEINGFKILTDPTLDNAGKLYHHGYFAFSKKTEKPALQNIDLSKIDLILLSHHQHKDNFDVKGKSFALASECTIISTKAASKKYKRIIGLDNWECFSVKTPLLQNLRITATPAQHRPWWIPEFVSGKVIGFIIEFDDQKNGVIYISGDTVYFKGIEEVAKRFKIDIGIIHLGSVQFRYLTGFGKYTMDSNDFIKAIGVLKPNKIIPIHYKGWTHFKEKEQTLIRCIESVKEIQYKTILLESGTTTAIVKDIVS